MENKNFDQRTYTIRTLSIKNLFEMIHGTTVHLCMEFQRLWGLKPRMKPRAVIIWPAVDCLQCAYLNDCGGVSQKQLDFYADEMQVTCGLKTLPNILLPEKTESNKCSSCNAMSPGCSEECETYGHYNHQYN
jgi:hypothetical protein